MRESPRYARLQTIEQTAPSKNFAKKFVDLPRKHGTLLFQLRTGHIALNKHLHRIARAPSATCQERNAHEETVHHFLLVCPKYARQRNALSMEIGPRQLNVKYLLSESKRIRATLKYDVTPPPLPPEGEGRRQKADDRGKGKSKRRERTQHVTEQARRLKTASMSQLTHRPLQSTDTTQDMTHNLHSAIA